MAKRDYTNKAAQNVENFAKPTPLANPEEQTETRTQIQKSLGVGPYAQEENEQPQNTEETQKIPETGPQDVVDTNAVKLQLIESTDERQTYYLTLQYVEALRILSYKKRNGISETLRDLLDMAITPETMLEAKNNLMMLSVNELKALKDKKRKKRPNK